MKRSLMNLMLLSLCAALLAAGLSLLLTDVLAESSAPGADDSAEGGAVFPMSVADFCGLPADLPDDVTVEAWFMDCESGPEPLFPSAEDRAFLLALVRGGVVTGKASDLFVTGGTTACVFFGPDGERLGTVELYEGLLVGPDGMYAFALPETP